MINFHGIGRLVRLHADLGGQIKANQAEAKRLAESMEHVEHVIRLFDSSYDVRRISARRRYKGNAWFKRGTIIQYALDVLRKATEPLTARQIAERMLIAKGVRDDASPKTLRSLVAAIQASLQNYDGKTVANVGEGMPGRWKVV